MKEINLTEVAAEVAEELFAKIQKDSEPLDEQSEKSARALLETGFVKGFIEGEKYISDQIKRKLGIKVEEEDVEQ